MPGTMIDPGIVNSTLIAIANQTFGARARPTIVTAVSAEAIAVSARILPGSVARYFVAILMPRKTPMICRGSVTAPMRPRLKTVTWNASWYRIELMLAKPTREIAKKGREYQIR